MLPVRQPSLLGALGLVTLIFLLSWSWKDRSVVTVDVSPPPPEEEVIEYPPEHHLLLENLQKYGVVGILPGSTIEYAKFELTAQVQPNFHPPLLQDIDIELPSSHTIDVIEAIEAPVADSVRTTVQVTKSPSTPDASSLIFGISTTLERLDDSIDAFVHWAAGTKARILVLIEQGPASADIQRVAERAKGLGLLVEIVPMTLEFNDRYFHLLKALHERVDAGTKWISFLDDDTFFPSTTNLLSLLGKYDASQPHFVGSLSEDFHQIGLWGIIGYGGAGVFLSVPLVNQLIPHYDSCNDKTETGDRRVAGCVLDFTTTRMSLEPGLHQVDLRDDGSGFYEALRPQPISVHHWKSWNKFPMDKIAYVAKICGQACLFQKYRLKDDWQLTNGISLIKYSHERGPDDIRMEMTWRNSVGEPQAEMFRHSLAPLKPKDENKIQYIMETATYDAATDVVRQIYVRRSVEQKRVGIVEVIWQAAAKR